MHLRLSLFFLLGLATCPAETLVFIGTYTRGESEGIYRASLDEKTGQLSPPVLAATVSNPSFIALHPMADLLYSVSEVGNYKGEKAGVVSSFRIGEDGSLTLLNEQSSGGPGPCHLAVDPSGGAVLVANYGGGSCASFPIEADGSLGASASFHQHAGSSVNPRRQKGPHAHSINTDPNGHRAFVADLGLDQILIYELDSGAGTLTPHEPPFVSTPAGGGPRHLAFHPRGGFAYTNLEMTSEIVAFYHDSELGEFTFLEKHSTLPDGFEGNNSTAEILVHPSGNYVYVSNRGHNSIAAFSIHPETGLLSLIDHESTGGETPRNFGIDPSGRFLIAANQKTGSVVSLAIDPDNGTLSSLHHEIQVPSPVCIRFLKR